MLWACNPDKVTYIQDKYWFYMEFQMNMALATVLVFIGSILNLRGAEAGLASYLIATIVAGALIYVFMWAARRNYLRHRSKMLSFKLAAAEGLGCAPESAVPKGDKPATAGAAPG